MHNQSFIEEMLSALRGLGALTLGRRTASTYFDFSQRGLAGSFIALLIATAVTAYAPQLLGAPTQPGDGARAVFLAALLFGLQIGAAYIVLRQMGRLDGLVPYLVADNWMNLFLSVIGSAIIVSLGPTDIVLLSVGIVSIIVEVNIARRIVTLMPMQIVLFMVAQLAAQMLGVLIFGGLIVPMQPPAG